MVIKHCDQCGEPLVKGANCKTTWAKRCTLINSDELSPCQKAKNRETAQATRDAQGEEEKQAQYEMFKKPKFSNIQREMRTCLKCDKKFLSEGKYNRICDICSELREGMKANNLSRAEKETENFDFILDNEF